MRTIVGRTLAIAILLLATISGETYGQSVTAPVSPCCGLIINAPYVTGRFYGPTGQSSSLSTTAAATTGSLYAMPFFVPSASSVASLSINVTVGNSASAWHFRVGIYSDNGRAAPGNLVAGSDAGEVTVAQNATGAQASTLSNVTLAPGTYWLAFDYDTTGATISAANNASSLAGTGINGCASIANLVAQTCGAGLKGTQAYGPLPATAPAMSLNTNSGSPYIFVKF